ncbi:MAG TPA: helix-turn-helix domain-containing protein [Patescibacteria group bacterium]|nr:helix-turn-helix domain-containing protein [Patescibacteria group bacterium]
MEKIEAIKNLGLDEKEAHVYLALLKIGGSLASQVAKEVGIKRTTIYPILQTLAEKGAIIVYFRKNKRFYYAQKPIKIAELFKKKLESFEGIIPLLETMEKKQGSQFGLRFIETVQELKQFYFEILEEYKHKQKKEYYAIGNAPSWEGLEPEFFIKYRKERANAKIHTKLLLTADSKETNEKIPIESLRDFKYLPKQYKFKSTIDIFKDKILIVSPDLSSLAVVIEIPAMVDIFRGMFEMLWEATPEK